MNKSLGFLLNFPKKTLDSRKFFPYNMRACATGILAPGASGGQKSKRRCNNMAKITGKYEVLYIIDPAQGEEGIAALVEKFKAMVEAEDTLSNVDEWGKRRLA